MKRVSITEMDTWQRCGRLWQYEYDMKLRKGVKSSPLSIGQAVHFGIEVGLVGGRDGVMDAALTCLRSGGGVEDIDERKVRKMVGTIPTWVWEISLPQVEMRLEVEYSLRNGETVKIVGKPDLWWMDDGLHVVEFKTTSKTDVDRELREYERWNPQPLRYVLLLKRSVPSVEVMMKGVRHVVLGANGKMAEGNEFQVGDRRLHDEESEMLNIAQQVGYSPTMSRTKMCEWCRFADLETVRLSGGDWQDKIEREYRGGVNET